MCWKGSGKAAGKVPAEMLPAGKDIRKSGFTCLKLVCLTSNLNLETQNRKKTKKNKI